MRKLDAKESKRIFFMMDVMRFNDYINFMEEFLEAEKINQEENLAKINAVTDPDGLTVVDRRIWYAQTGEFAGLLRKSFFISTFSFFENRLISEYRSRRNNDIDTRGELQKAIDYFTKNSLIEFPKDIADSVTNYRIIRNCIVHAQGRLNELKPEKDREKLQNYFNKKTNNVFLVKEEIQLQKEFCAEALQNIEAFLRLALFPDEIRN